MDLPSTSSTQYLFVRANTTNLPKINICNILEYLGESDKHNKAEIRGAKLLLTSRDSYLDSAVGYVEIRRDNNICIVRASVVPEHRVNKKNYLVSVTIDESQNLINDAVCDDCPASSGGCNHSMVLLFWLQKKSMEPATSVECYWKKPRLSRAGAESVESKEIYPKLKKPKLDAKDPKILEAFLKASENKDIGKPLILNILVHNPLDLKNFSVFHLTIDFYKNKNDHSFSNFKTYTESVLTPDIKSSIAKSTVAQSSSNLWHSMRQGRITGSKLHEIAHCATPEGSLVESILGGYKVPETKAILRGKKLENKVLKKTEQTLNCKINQTGYYLINGFIGASPDGIASDFIVEIKCPLTEKPKASYVKSGVINNKYRAQLQLEMLCTNKKKALFVLADTQFETNGKIDLVWEEFNINFLNNLLEKAEVFWKQNIFPKILKSVSLTTYFIK